MKTGLGGESGRRRLPERRLSDTRDVVRLGLLFSLPYRRVAKWWWRTFPNITTTLTKFDGQFNQLWTKTLANFRLGQAGFSSNPLAVDASGNIFVGARPKRRQCKPRSAKFLPDGTASWTRQQEATT